MRARCAHAVRNGFQRRKNDVIKSHAIKKGLFCSIVCPWRVGDVGMSQQQVDLLFCSTATAHDILCVVILCVVGAAIECGSRFIAGDGTTDHRC